MMANHRALIVDDEPDIRELISITLGRMHIDTSAAADLGEARALLQAGRFDLCLTDMRLPDGNGLDLVTHIQQHYPRLPVAVITAHGNLESAVQALKSGAFDFVTKPVDLNDLRSLVAQAVKVGEPRGPEDNPLIGASEQIQRVTETIAKLARSQAPVYISGESGTGKELVARLIHAQGPRKDQAFVPVNCGAFPHDLIESELFGHTKGSFTGALADKPGLFQAAHGGTLFLDELAELPMLLQVKLLRAIQEKKVRPVGAQRETAVDCRILSATHKDLAALVASGQFRQDLYYRINVIELRVPPLRERPGDIPLLVAHFLQRLSAQTRAPAPVLAEDAHLALARYRFPGNVRELENVIERAATLCESGVIHAEDFRLPENEPGAAEGVVPAVPDADPERQRILKALEQTRWNRTQAAKMLGMSLRALRYRLDKLHLDGS